jgi:hypothetical protein
LPCFLSASDNSLERPEMTIDGFAFRGWKARAFPRLRSYSRSMFWELFADLYFWGDPNDLARMGKPLVSNVRFALRTTSNLIGNGKKGIFQLL